MSLQIEHKTEKGTVLFVKVPEWFTSISHIDKSNVFYWSNEINPESFGNYPSQIPLKRSGDWNYLGLSKNISEDNAKIIMTDVKGFFDFGFSSYKIYSSTENYSMFALDSFKSLMEHLQVYEVNPFGMVEPNVNQYDLYNASQDYADGLEIEIAMNKQQWQEAQQRTGKWIVLFKPND